MMAEQRSLLRVALLGAGGFVKDAYLGPLRANSDKLMLAACWSRTADSVWAILPAVQEFYPSCKPYHGDGGLQSLLASADVDAVLVVLPPQAQRAVIQAALRAGKHVLSEKPAAPTLAQAEQLLAFHRSLPQPAPLWCVAENYRSIESFLRLRDAITAGELGIIARLDMQVDLALSPGSKYYDSAWRRDSSTMPGAYLTEGGVHFVAALRMAAGAAGWGEVTAVAAAARGVAEDLPHPDTLQGTLWFESGAAAGYSITLAAGAMQVALRAVGTKGTAEAVRGGFGGSGRAFRLVTLLSGQAAPVQTDSSSSGVEEELLCFARLARAASPAHEGVPLMLTAREAGAAAATDGSDPEADAVQAGAAGAATLAPAGAGASEVRVHEEGGKARLKDMPSEEDACRISCVEAVRDLAVVSALLASAADGGQKTPVAAAPSWTASTAELPLI